MGEEPDIINSNESIVHVVSLFQDRSKNYVFKVTVPEKPAELFVDKGKIEKVLKNILNNAVKFSPEGGLIKVAGEITGDNYQVTVEDQGIGMTSEQVNKIFDKFYRVDTSDTALEGTGLGMSIVKYIVEAHNGKVWVESTSGKGTAVKFTIPL